MVYLIDSWNIVYPYRLLQMKFSEKELLTLLSAPQGIHHLPRMEFMRRIRERPYQLAEGKKLILIDMKYWVSFRMVLYNEPTALSVDQQRIYREIHQQLLKLVGQKSYLCVISDSILNEMCKLPLERQLATARIMDDLGVRMVLNGLDTCTYEYMNIDRIIAGKEPIENYHLSSVFEANRFLVALLVKEHGSAPDLIFNITYDSMVSMTVEEYLKETYGNLQDSSVGFANMANNAKLEEQTDHTYDQLLVEGLASQLSSLRKLVPYVPEGMVDPAKHLALYRKVAPFLYLHSSILAAINVDRHRKIQPNDYYDLYHSCMGIGYADYFFTEKKFHHLLRSRPVECQSYCSCEIYSEPSQILEMLVLSKKD